MSLFYFCLEEDSSLLFLPFPSGKHKKNCWLWTSRWLLLEALDKVSPGSVRWKQASRPPIAMPFKRVENCNQAIDIGKTLKFSLVNVAGTDIVQGNKKLILGR